MSDGKQRVIVTYDSNNSGGDWWLKTEDWEALAEAGWNVHWVQPSEYGGYSRPSIYEDPLKPLERIEGAEWLDGVAMSAAKEFENPADAIVEFERVTGQDPSAIGCACCEQPHSFAISFDRPSEEGEPMDR